MVGYGNFNQILYYEVTGVILTLHTLGLFLEERSKGQMSTAIEKLINLAPKTATIIRNGEEVEVIVDEVAVGDIIRVRPGEIPQQYFSNSSISLKLNSLFSNIILMISPIFVAYTCIITKYNFLVSVQFIVLPPPLGESILQL